METDEIIRKIGPSIDTLPADVLRLLALKLPCDNVVEFCRISKRFNREICQNNIFQKSYGLLYLTLYENKLPQDREGNYVVLKELDKIHKLVYPFLGTDNIDEESLKYIVKRGYNQFVKTANCGKNNRGTLLVMASQYPDLDMVKYLLNGDIFLDYKTIAIREAIRGGHIDVLHDLIYYGAVFKPVSG